MRQVLEKLSFCLNLYMTNIFMVVRIVIYLISMILLLLIIATVLTEKHFMLEKSSFEIVPDYIINKESPNGISLQTYNRVFNAQNLFSTNINPKQESNDNNKSNANITTLLSNYEIRGIVWGNKPKAIIYDKINKTTKAFAVGDSLGQIEILKISSDEVIFQLLEEMYEFKY